MLTLILFYFLISFTCIWSGFLLVNSCRGKQQVPAYDSWMTYGIWGLICVCFVAQITALFMPVNQFSLVVYGIVLTAISFFKKKGWNDFLKWIADTRKMQFPFLLLLMVTVIFVSMYNSGPTLMDDTDSYHIQMVKWLQQYGSPPGLANLHERYGFNSSWFSFIAFFAPANSPYNFFTVCNGLLSLWFSLYLLQKIWMADQTAAPLPRLVSFCCAIVFIAALFCWPMIRGNARTSNYDFISTVLCIVLLIEVFSTGKNWHHWLPELLIWPVFLFTVRIINYPFLLISLFAFIELARRKFQAINLAAALTFPLLLVVPFLARNVLLSGYLFYPAYQIDFFNVDWKADKQLAVEIMDFIKYFNRVNAGYIPTSVTATFKTPSWIPLWFHYLFTYDKPLLMLGISGYAVVLFRMKIFYQLSIAIRCIFLVFIVQLISWFVVAPDPRFVYGPLLAGLFFIPVFFHEAVERFYTRKMATLLSMVLGISMFVYMIFKMATDEHFRHAVFPYRLPVPPTTVVEIGDIRLRIPEKINGNWNRRCYGTVLPCLYELQPGLKPRGKSIADGFKIDSTYPNLTNFKNAAE